MKMSGPGIAAGHGEQTGICVGLIPLGGKEQEHLLPKGWKFTLFLVKAETMERGKEKRKNGFQLTGNTEHPLPLSLSVSLSSLLLLLVKFPASFNPNRFSLTWSDRNRRQLQEGSREMEKHLKTDFKHRSLDRQRNAAAQRSAGDVSSSSDLVSVP